MCKVSGKNIHWCWRYSKERTNLGWTHRPTDGRTEGRSPNHYPPPKHFFLVGDNNVSITYIFSRKLLFCHMSLTNFTVIFDALVIIKINCSIQVSLGTLSKRKYLSLISFKHLHLHIKWIYIFNVYYKYLKN